MAALALDVADMLGAGKASSQVITEIVNDAVTDVLSREEPDFIEFALRPAGGTSNQIRLTATFDPETFREHVTKAANERLIGIGHG